MRVKVLDILNGCDIIDAKLPRYCGVKGDVVMAIKFGTAEWMQALHDQLNASEAYAQAAQNWEGDFYFIAEADGPVTQPMYLYLDLWHGKCRAAFPVTDKSAKNPAFVMSGPYSTWVQVVKGKLDPLQALATGKLKLKGNMITIMKNVKAAQEIVKCCTRIETAFEM